MATNQFTRVNLMFLNNGAPSFGRNSRDVCAQHSTPILTQSLISESLVINLAEIPSNVT
jgi:hypothetical protein